MAISGATGPTAEVRLFPINGYLVLTAKLQLPKLPDPNSVPQLAADHWSEDLFPPPRYSLTMDRAALYDLLGRVQDALSQLGEDE